MKLLLILLTVLAIVWLLRGARRVPPPPGRGEAPAEPTGRAVQTLARCAHCGKCQGLLLMKKKQRVTTVTRDKPTITPKVQMSVWFMAGLPAARRVGL